MVEVRFHPGKNRLYVTMSGDLTEAELVAGRDQILRERDRIRPHFDVVNDVRGVTSIHPLAAKLMAELVEPLRQMQLHRTVRVVGKSATAASFFERESRRIGMSGAFLAFSAAEADRLLDGEVGIEHG